MRWLRGIVCLLMLAGLPTAGRSDVPLVSGDATAGDERLFLANLAEGRDGTLFELASVPLVAGRYRLCMEWSLHPLGSVVTSGLVITCTANGQARTFHALHFDRTDAFQPVTVDFDVAEGEAVPLSVTWEATNLAILPLRGLELAKKPEETRSDQSLAANEEDDFDELEAIDRTLGNMTLEKAQATPYRLLARNLRLMRLVPVKAQLTSRKIVYKPGEAIAGSLELENLSATAQTFRCAVRLESGTADTTPLHDAEISLPPRGRTTLPLTVEPARLSRWGHALSATLSSDGCLPVTARTTLGVTDNFWELAIVTTHRRLGMMTHDPIPPETAAANVDARVRDGFTAFEAFFWAPCDMIEYTPATERFNGCQGAYPFTVTGTRNTIAAAHDRGMAATFYANLWGAAATPGMELMRRHPESFGEAHFSAEFVSDWDLLDRGLMDGPTGIWFYNQVHSDKGAGIFDVHAREIIASAAMFGWDGTRYDSYYSAEWSKKATTRVRELVEKELPGYRWGYNSLVPADVQTGAIDIMIKGGHLIMEEGAMKKKALAGVAAMLASYREELARHGGHLGLVVSLPEKQNTFADLLYASVCCLAGGAHPYYAQLETGTGDFPAFALRYAEYLWDGKLLRLPKDADTVRIDGAERFPLSKHFFREADLGGGRRRMVAHLFDAPEGYGWGADLSMNMPEPVRDVGVAFALPEGAAVTGAWSLSPRQQPECVPLAPAPDSGGVWRVTVPLVRTWSMIVLEYTLPVTKEATP